jgi:FkbM family methyltransferase
MIQGVEILSVIMQHASIATDGLGKQQSKHSVSLSRRALAKIGVEVGSLLEDVGFRSLDLAILLFRSKLLRSRPLIERRLLSIVHQMQERSTALSAQSLLINPYRSLNELDRKIEQHLPQILNSNSFYIEAGANDGISQSNTTFLEIRYGARGMLIEPSPSNFERCIKNRSSRNIFENCALVSNEYNKPYMELIYSNLMTVSTESPDVNPVEHAQSGLQFFDGVNYSFLSKTATLAELMDKHGVQSVDLLSLDLEGFELDALKGARLEERRIKNIVAEARNIDEVSEYLQPYHYKMIAQISYHDYIFSLE